ETPGNIGQRTHQIVQGTGIKRVAPTVVQYWARDFASDYRYHGRQQEAPRIARTRLLYSAKASQRRDKRPQDACSYDRCCGRMIVASVTSSAHTQCSLPISGGPSTRGVVASTGRINAKISTSVAPAVLDVSTGYLSRPSKKLADILRLQPLRDRRFLARSLTR
ncbi:unnamed protein product, partial [Ascophyllum nodosum]